MSKQQTIFIKVQLFDRLRLLNELISQKGEIQCKLERTGQFITLKPNLILHGAHLVCRKEADISPPSGLPAEAIVTFTVANNRYFFHTELPAPHEDAFSLPIPHEVYQLQRRQSFRASIPETYPAHVILTPWKSQDKQYEARILDISQGGCRILLGLDAPTIESAQALSGSIHIGLRNPFAFVGLVRHSSNINGQTVGLEFTDLTTIFQSRIKSVMLEVHKDLFFQKKKPS